MINIFREIPLFSSLKDEELEAIARVSVLKNCPKDTLILIEDEEGDALFIIREGKVKVTSFSETGKEVIFSILGVGDFFGDMSLLDGKPRSASVISIEESSVYILRRADFHSIIEKHPNIALKLLKELTSRLRKADERIESLAFLDVRGRVAGILLQLAEESGEKTPEGIVIRSRPTHQDLANMVGTTRETVTRILKQIENGNYITLSGKDVTILDTERLKRELYF
ncbi:MAG: Crp/Fnr family transcriptional regulator [Candidatus Latescibacter sp.]|nr:Crp/Fnr family transcriptional regulator [Candidatus Latescibacter sp.]